MQNMKDNGITAPFHYVPLHSSPAGKRFGTCGSSMQNTLQLHEELVRLPMYSSIIDTNEQDYVIKTIGEYFEQCI